MNIINYFLNNLAPKKGRGQGRGRPPTRTSARLAKKGVGARTKPKERKEVLENEEEGVAEPSEEEEDTEENRGEAPGSKKGKGRK